MVRDHLRLERDATESEKEIHGREEIGKRNVTGRGAGVIAKARATTGNERGTEIVIERENVMGIDAIGDRPFG